MPAVSNPFVDYLTRYTTASPDHEAAFDEFLRDVEAPHAHRVVDHRSRPVEVRRSRRPAHGHDVEVQRRRCGCQGLHERGRIVCAPRSDVLAEQQLGMADPRALEQTGRASPSSNRLPGWCARAISPSRGGA